MTVIRTIAVGFDGSCDAEVALRWAFNLATPLEADVVLVHAMGLLEHVNYHRRAIELETFARRLSHQCQFNIEHLKWRLVDGDACSALARSAQPPISADMLVVGSRGRGAHAGLLLGSTSLELAEHCTIPLVVVPVTNRPTDPQ